MSQKITMHCDRCGAEFITGSHISVTGTEIEDGAERHTLLRADLTGFRGADLCGDCTAGLMAYLRKA